MPSQVLLGSILCATLLSQPKQETTVPPLPAPASAERRVAPPRLTIEPRGRVQLGSVGPREKKTIAYTFTNTSDTPIRMRVTDLSPGVTVTGPALETPIPPRESLPLSLFLDPTGFVGWQARSVRLFSDDPDQGEYRLPIGMEVRPDLTVDDQRKAFGVVAPHESPEVTFRFHRETGDPTALRLTNPLPPYLQTSLDAHENMVDLRVVFRAGLVPVGATMGLESLEVATNSPQQSTFTLYVVWAVQHAIEPVPPRVVLTEATAKLATLTLRARDGKPFLVERTSLEGSGFSIEPAQPAGGAEQAVTIHRTALTTARAVLVLFFKDQESPLKVPLAFLPPEEPDGTPRTTGNPTEGSLRK